MPIRTVAQAAADIRLSDAKANVDFERIRRQLVARATRLEADLAVSIPVTLDQKSLAAAAAGIERISDNVPAIDIPAIVDTDEALGEIQALTQLGQPVVMPVTADTDAALADIIALTELDVAVRIPVTVDTTDVLERITALGDAAPEIDVPVAADVESASADIGGLGEGDTVVTIPVVAETDEAKQKVLELGETETSIKVPVDLDAERLSQQIARLGTTTGLFGGGINLPLRASVGDVRTSIDRVLAGEPFSIKVRSNVTDLAAEVATAGDAIKPVDVPVVGNTDDLAASVARAGESVQPIPVPAVLGNTDQLIQSLRRIEPPPLLVPITAAEAGPGASKQALSRISADLDAAIAGVPPVHIPAVATTDKAISDITAVSKHDFPPAVVPVVPDTDQLHAQINHASAGIDPMFVPVEADLARVQGKLRNLRSVQGENPLTVPVNIDDTQVAGEARNASRAANQEFEKSAREGGGRAGAAFGRQFSASLNGILATAAIAVGGFFASSLVEGFQRFTTIEDSTESLTVALQDAGEAAAVLDDVLNVVRGTPFRLDDFARAATNMISFGIAADKVPRFLTAIGEAAATRGSQATQFAQSLSTIFGQVQAIGKINGEDIWQFGNVGVDVLRILGNTLGQTTEEIRKMISEGAIPADFALESIASGILDGTTGINGATVAFSGVMERLGDTLSGSIENFGAARARFGVAIIEPLSDTLTEGFQSLTKVVDIVTADTRDALDEFVKGDFVQGVNNFFEALPEKIGPAIDALQDFGPALAPLGIAFGALGLGAIGSILGPLGALIPGVTGLAGAATVAAAAFAILTPEIRDELLPTLVEFGEVGADVGGTFIRGVGDALEGLSPVFIRALGVLRGEIPDIQTFLGAAFAGAGKVGEAALPVLDRLVDFAQDALPTAFRIATDGVTLLAEAAVAAAPIVLKLVDVGEDLLPTFEGLLTVAERVGGVLIPALDGLGRVIGAIPVGVLETLLGVFLGFKAVSFFQTQMDAVGGALTRVRGQIAQTSIMFNQFQIQGQNNFQAFGNAVRTLGGTGQIAASAGSAIAGAFSGMALASENSAARITGAVSAIGSVLTGLATGGLPGGLFAAAGVGIGFIAEGFIKGQQESDRLKASVKDLAATIEAEFNDELVNFNGVINSRVFTDVVKENIGTDTLDELTNDIGLRLADLVEAARVSSADLQTAISEGITPEEAAKQRFDGFVAGIEEQLLQLRANAKGIDIDALRTLFLDTQFNDPAHFAPTNEQLGQWQDLNSLITDTHDDVGGLRTAWDLTEKSAAAVRTSQIFAGESAREAGEQGADAANEAADALAAWKKETADTTLSAEELRDMFHEAGDAAVSAADQAKDAFERFGDTLDDIKGKLDLTTATQNLNADLRGIGESLDEIVNVDDLNKVDRISKDIDQTEDRIADLQARLAEQNARANEKAGLLEQRIDKADAIGAVNAAAELRRQLGEVFDDANDTQDDIDKQFQRINELKGELNGLTTEPITRMQQLQKQAAEANLSFFDFLLAGPTDEARSFFQDELGGTVEGGLDKVNKIAEEQGPIAGAKAANEFLTSFRTSLTDAGIDPATVDALVANLLPADILETNAQTAAQAAVAAFFAEIEATNSAPEGTLDIPARITDLDAKATEIENFLKDHPEIKLPIGIDVDDFDSEIEKLKTRATQEGIQAERDRFGERNPEALNEFIKATQTDAEKAAEDSAKKILDEINDLDPDTMDVPVRVTGIEKEIADLQADLSNAKIRLPVELSIDTLNVTLDAAEVQARIAERLSALQGLSSSLPFGIGGGSTSPGTVGRERFAQGGITGYRDGPHAPQIAYGERIWAEPETGGEAYIPLGMGKRMSALGVFMKVAEIFDFAVQPRNDDVRIVTPNVSVPAPDVRIIMPPALERTSVLDRVLGGDNTTVIERTSMLDHATTTVLDRAAAAAASVPITMIPNLRVPDVVVHLAAPTPPPPPAPPKPITQDDFDGVLRIGKIEKLVIGDGAPARKRASQMITELKRRAFGS